MEGRSGKTGTLLASDWEEEVESPLSRLDGSGFGCTSLLECKGKVDDG